MTQFRRKARSLHNNYLFFPHFQKKAISNFDSPSVYSCTCESKHRSIDLAARQQVFSPGALFSLIFPHAPSLDFLTNTCGRGVEGEVLWFRLCPVGRALTRCVGNRGKCLMWQLLASWIFTNHSLLITLMSV